MCTNTSSRLNRVADLRERIGMFVVFVGLLLTVTLDPRFVLIIAIGVLGPHVVRALDRTGEPDEFRAEILRRSGFRSYLVVCAVLIAVIAVSSSGGSLAGSDLPLQADVLLVTALLVFYLSYLLEFWGARDGSIRVFLAFGLLAFIQSGVVLTQRGSVSLWWASVVELLGIVVIYFIPVLTIRRWPRVSGVILTLWGVVTFAALLTRFDNTKSVFVSAWKLAYLPLWICLPFLVCGIDLIRSEWCARGDGRR
jgi:hypothetical protein